MKMAKLLIVDDNEQILQILSRYAQAQGHQTVLARTGPQALELFAAQQPDLVLLDVMLPGWTALGCAGKSVPGA